MLGLAEDTETRGRVRELSANISGRKGPALAADAVLARLEAA